VEVVASVSQGRRAAAQCGLFTHKSVPVIFEPPCTLHTKDLNVRRTMLHSMSFRFFRHNVSVCKLKTRHGFNGRTWVAG